MLARHLLSAASLLICAALAFTATGAATQAAEVHARTFGLPPGAIARAKERLAAAEGDLQAALKQLLSDADKTLKLAPLSVMEKPVTPPSGDKHDYMSQGPYFWPNPKTKDGLPYIRRDGQRNPESEGENSDSPRFSRLAKAAETLGLAYALSGREHYAAHAAQLLRTWFLDPATRMNPNCNYAQAVPGVSDGRSSGMIESRSIIPAMDAASLIESSKSWSDADRQGLDAWMSAFLDWAQTSANGRGEANATNNHGSFYDLQITHLALFIGQRDLARQTVEAVKEKRIAKQIQPNGFQPLELGRADSFGYSRFNAEALFELANLGDYLGIDLWHYEAPGGGSLRKALDFLLPYAEDPAKEWPYEHGHKSEHSLDRLLWPAAAIYGDARYKQAVGKIPNAERQREALFFPIK